MEELQALLVKIITRIMRLLTRQGFIIEEQGTTYLAQADRDRALTPLQAAWCTYRIALGPRAGQKVLSLQIMPSTDKSSMPGLCANAHGFSLRAAVRCGADQRKQLEHLCQYITRPAIAKGVQAGKLSSRSYVPALEENNARQGFLDHASFLALRENLPEYLKDPVTFLYLSGWRVSEMKALE